MGGPGYRLLTTGMLEGRCGMMLVTIRPGPVLHVWQGGEQVAAVPLSSSAALRLASDLLRALSISMNEEQS